MPFYVGAFWEYPFILSSKYKLVFAAPQDLPREVTSGQPDDALLRGLTRYLSSMSLTVRVLDQGFVQRIQELGEQMTQQPEDAATGRNKTTGQVV